ncbi:unnamed protein product [Rotaria socialis]|uniref:Uncharacterized protein n=1 Tax=Rotaria socialis TaxID=392032 RepID=A0A820EGV8_9BILA|nr:unnamed protein product [Rotaria socialis]CAF4187484.1 unnamed protein product [Rotaria socialis]CAF4248379.1 unnamed protein product [Rotaria socialis]CAF4590463.1 unnamed protein product [Rotaria socialis]
MMQLLIESKPYTSSFLLAAYGTSNTFKAIDILNRWIWIFEKSQESNVRIVAFSTDCDPRYLLAKRLTTGFFSKLTNTPLYNHNNILKIHLPNDWSGWFFMPPHQVFFCFQDSIHLCAKLRNRMLSETASLLIGNGEVSIQVLNELIETKSKFVHGLVKTDIKTSYRQNYKSCHKILREGVINALEDIDDSLATQIYLRLLCSVSLAYINHNTSIIDCIYHSWLAVFICCIWQTWLHLVHKEDISESHSQMSKENLFITAPAHLSIEMNAHSLVAICLLVHQQDLPISALRSMSGVFSTVVNFITEQLLKRAGKLSVLADIQNQSESAYDDAYHLLSKLDVHIALKKAKKTEILQVRSFVRAQFDRKFKKVSYDDDESYLSDNDESSYKFRSDINTAADLDDDSSCDDETENMSSISASGKSQFHGMRVCDTIPSSLAKSYFRVELDGKKIYSQTDSQLAVNRY